ncbi:MAG TPA: fused MFS/spermidine synthase [Saprospiraceae bacterium]|nr:fused MFS/spermidine synthase [Saprospiraceae bacterium]HMU04900.1 fused MFS/spermidine synthase [Saprospiraceae bacterium]
MKPNLITNLLSYITQQHMETIQSDYNEMLHVFLKDGRFQLCTANAIYSYGDKYDNFRRSFAQMDLDKMDIDNVLLLGFGLGSIPFMLEKTFRKKYAYTGVEIDESIIYLASKYVLDELTSEIELIQADAYSYIYQTQMKYDLICVDIFVDDKIPEVFLDVDFLEAVTENLTDSGVIMFNHLAYTKDDKVAAEVYYKDVFKKVFPDGKCLDVKGNLMMVNRVV